MDLGRLLCDVQHADSVTRRNFILFSLKKEMSEHLSSTKIDFFLFGESLAETLKAAKSIYKNLNRKAPGPSYRQSGHIQRSREPAPRARAAPLPLAHSSRPWPRQQPPPPPPPAQARRRF
ncbi:hypothetical protein ABMA28_002632 [Loxostege sticticalis]|uniref:Uncharacterized protein n=1 Tax=Loxostege sticticalis TaxID=481309 RepID=A0ABD0SXI6_LOXSC